MSNNVIGFLGARRRAFALELRSINREFRGQLCRIRALSVDRWWFEDDPALARACVQAEITTKAIIMRLEKCIAAARKYGADPAPFERGLKRWRSGAAA